MAAVMVAAAMTNRAVAMKRLPLGELRYLVAVRRLR